MTKEFFKNRKSDKWKRLYDKFRKGKRAAIRGLNYDVFADQMIKGSRGNFYRQVKKVGGLKQKVSRLNIESLEGKSDYDCAQAIGEAYSAISQTYSPVDLTALPAFLPAQLPPQVQQLQVWERLGKLKKTKSTFPIDLPEKLRKEFAVELSAPLTNILNSCLSQGVFPLIWKEELVVPVPKKEILKVVKDTRKITCLSDFCKIYEGFLKTWILEDLSKSESFSQFGGKSGVAHASLYGCRLYGLYGWYGS